MSLTRLYCPVLNGDTVSLGADEAQHALRSLRLNEGDRVTLFDGQGGVATGVLCPDASDSQPSRSRRRPRALMVQLEKRTRIEPPARRLTLIAAAPKADRLRWMVEKCTELGATSLMVAEFERSVVHVRADQSEKLRRYAIEACKQCGRAWLPEIECGLSALPAAESASGHRFVADLTPGAAPLSQALAACGDEAVVLVGPEGGLAPGEREALTGNQVQAVSLGANTLRTETAAIAIAAVWANLAQGG